MEWIIVGLGNPGKEYDGTRHNIGRDMLIELAQKECNPKWVADEKKHSQSAKVKLFGKSARLLLPNTYMNTSGNALKSLITSKKEAEKLIVVHDDLDLPLGVLRISFGSGAGGHRGVESIQKTIKNKDFFRIRIGISPQTPSGKIKKPNREKVVDFVLGTFKTAEQIKIKKIKEQVKEGLRLLLTEGRSQAMNYINTP